MSGAITGAIIGENYPLQNTRLSSAKAHRQSLEAGKEEDEMDTKLAPVTGRRSRKRSANLKGPPSADNQVMIQTYSAPILRSDGI